MNPSASMEIKHNSSSKSESVDEGGLTGQVGTALYVSPEMTNSQTRTNYNQVRPQPHSNFTLFLPVFSMRVTLLAESGHLQLRNHVLRDVLSSA